MLGAGVAGAASGSGRMDLKEALTTAIHYEHMVRDHYLKAREEVLSPQGKRVFDTLAREEQGHVDYLESRLAEWSHWGKISSPELATALPPLDWVAEARRKVSGGPDRTVAVQEELELLKVALELERQTSSFYRKLVDTLPEADRGMFARFLEIEAGHLAIVQAEIDSLNGMGTWFDFMEFSLEAG